MDSDFYNWCLQQLDYLECTIDPIAIVSELVKKERVSKAERNFIYRLENRREIWRRLIMILQHKCPFGTFLDAVEDCGYSIRLHRNQLEYPKRSNCRTPSRDFAQRLLVNLKTQTHNAVFANPREYLNKLSCSYYHKFVRETDFYRRQAIADKYASVICAEIDSHIMLFKDSDITKKKIQILKGLITHTTNACVTGVAYNARMAIASSLAGEFETAEEYIKMSKTDSYNIHACVEVENMLYIEVFNLLSRYEVQPSVQLRDEILRTSDDGLQLLEYEDEASRLFWRRMFLIRMTFCLFGLSMKFVRIPGCYIDQVAITRGKKYLAEIDKSWEGIESRRKIWYYVARARQFELECDYTDMDTALWYVNQAIDIASKGSFSEGEFAVEYRQGLLSQKEILEAERDIKGTNSSDFTGHEDEDFSSFSASESEDLSPDIDMSTELHDCDLFGSEMSFESYISPKVWDYQSICKHDIASSCFFPSLAKFDIKIESFLSSLSEYMYTSSASPIYSLKEWPSHETSELSAHSDFTHCSLFSSSFSRVLYDSYMLQNNVLPHFQKVSFSQYSYTHIQGKMRPSHYLYQESQYNHWSRNGVISQSLTFEPDSLLLSLSLQLFKGRLCVFDRSKSRPEHSHDKSKEGEEHFDTEPSLICSSEFSSDNKLSYTSLYETKAHQKYFEPLQFIFSSHNEPIEHVEALHLEPIEHSLELHSFDKQLSVSSLLFDDPLSLDLITSSFDTRSMSSYSRDKLASVSDDSGFQAQQLPVEHYDDCSLEEMDSFKFSSFL